MSTLRLYMDECSNQIWYSAYQGAVVLWLACQLDKLQTRVWFPVAHQPIIASRSFGKDCKLATYLLQYDFEDK